MGTPPTPDDTRPPLSNSTEGGISEADFFRIHEEYRGILNAVGDGVHWIGPDGRILFENPASASMLGYEVHELIGRGAHAVMHHTRANGCPFPVTECSIYATLRDGKIRDVKDEVFWRKDGTSFAVEYTCRPTHDDRGNITGSVVTFTDITERLALQKGLNDARLAAERASDAKTHFLANMSHEIRTPLNGIIGMTELLVGTTLNAEQKDFLETIHASSENLLTIVNDVLDFSKIEFGKLELDYHAFNLLDLIDEVVGLLHFRASKKKLEFLTGIQTNLPVDYMGDANRIRQVLVNLVANAIKFTEQGEISVEIAAGLARPQDEVDIQRLVFHVRDTGLGIPPDRIDRLFKVFSQIDSSTTRRFGGSGLGLAICHKLVEIMGGVIKVESAPDFGSTFSFEIPLRLGQPDKESLEGTILTGRRALIVDDLEPNRRMLAIQLSRWGMDWIDVVSGEDAIARLQMEVFDVALIDFQMPSTDGLMLARQIGRLQLPKPLPLILVTSQAGDLSPEESRKAGFFAVIGKPLRLNLLRSTLEQVFRTAQPPPAASPEPKLAQSYPLRILTVEDNATNRKVARQILARLGYETALVDNGMEAVAAIQGTPYDLILMDIHMPEMDGLTATRAIRGLGYPRGAPFIVALTADVVKGERELCLEAGMDDFLSKPIKIDALKNLIDGIGRRIQSSA